MTRTGALKDYSTSPAPNFDAVEDVKAIVRQELRTILLQNISEYSGHYEKPKNWHDVCQHLRVLHPFQRQAWYDHHFGQGAWLKANAIDAVATMEPRRTHRLRGDEGAQS